MDRQEKIDGYLHGRMSPEDRHAFEANMRNDEQLAQEVSFWQEVGAGILPDASDELRPRLQMLGQQFINKRKRRWLWFLLTILLLGIAFMFWSYSTIAKESVSSSPPLSEEHAPPIDSSTVVAPIQEVPTSPPEDSAPTIQQLSPPPTPPATPPTNVPIAANFDSSPPLEELIGQQLRSQQLELQLGIADLSIEKAPMLSGHIIVHDRSKALPILRCLIFSNDEEAYFNFEYLQAISLFTPDQMNKDTLTVEQVIPEPLDQGRYYYLIEDESSGIIYDIGRFDIR